MKIPISLLSSFFYCPYKAYYEYHGFPAEETVEIKEGRRWHEILEEEHRRKANMKVSIKDSFRISKEENLLIIFREVPVEEETLYGKIDEVWVSPSSVVVMDDKPKLNFGYKLQVIGYAYAFLKNYEPDRPIVMGIRRRENKQFLWYEAFERKHKIILKKYIEKVLSVINGEKMNWKIDRRRCIKCKYRKICRFRHSIQLR